jgi:hypothetical protein
VPALPAEAPALPAEASALVMPALATGAGAPGVLDWPQLKITPATKQ